MAGGVIGKITTDGTGAGTHLLSHTFYGTCSTAAGTQQKVVKISDSGINAATLLTGMLLSVKFTYSNTAVNPTMVVQPSGSSTNLIAAKSIMMNGTTPPGATEATSWKAGAIVDFMYDGTNWQMVSSLNSYTTIYRITEA